MNDDKFKGFFSGLSMWALAFGCIIGWGSFVMPGTAFLPDAGPVGTVIGVSIAAAMVLTVALNYAFLAERFPGDGTYGYTKKYWAKTTLFCPCGRYGWRTSPYSGRTPPRSL